VSDGPARRPICVLPDDLANQIAAGEVVERPASVVKELVENALDAEARRVTVDIEGGGVARIRVADDGLGMAQEDARLAVLRHATSKLRTLDDLRHIGSFGFRGEALPSIASVSHFALLTRRRGDAEGTEVRVDGGGAARTLPCGTAEGTIVEVSELFYNVPARRKFLRAVPTESAQVTEVVEAAALSAPRVTFVLGRDGRRVREWLRADNREERARATFVGEELATCRGTRGPLTVEAYLGRPERARTGASGLRLFVNGRPVKDRQLARAVAHAYGSVLESGRYPVGVVYLDLPHDLVDVNVHPQKAEVRFADGRAAQGALVRIIEEQVRAAFGLPGLAAPIEAKPALFEAGGRGALAPWLWSSAPSPEGLVASPAGGEPGGSLPYPAAARVAEDAPGTQPLSVVETPLTTTRETTRPPFATLRFLAQVRRMYLVCEGDDGLYVLDQHAAAERVTFHRLRRAYASREVASQKLLFPELVEVAPAEVALVEEAEEEIRRVGLEARAVGPTQIAIHAVPQLLVRADPGRLLRDLLDEVDRRGDRGFSSAVDLALATMACHGSVRAGDAVAAEEAIALLHALDEVDFAGHCPHGRPVVTALSWNELAHGVGRR
jgi:DNA mismatch repair protein MutL